MDEILSHLKKTVSRVVWIIFVIASQLYAEDCSLTVNTPQTEKKPKSYRTTYDPTPGASWNNRLYTLNASASAQFSEAGLKYIIKKTPCDKLLVIDLRQESHGFLDGSAISWLGEHNWANLNLSLDEILQDEHKRLSDLRNLKNTPYSTHKFNIESEEELVTRYGLSYLRIPVSDHRKPSDDQVDRFVVEIKKTPSNIWIHFHCCGGKGRATTFMVLYDIMKNSDHTPLNDILKRQALLGGKDLSNPYASKPWKQSYHTERMIFIQNFYKYWDETKGEIPFGLWNQLEINRTYE